MYNVQCTCRVDHALHTSCHALHNVMVFADMMLWPLLLASSSTPNLLNDEGGVHKTLPTNRFTGKKGNLLCMFLSQGTCTHSLTAPTHLLAHSFSSPSQLLCVTPAQAAVQGNDRREDMARTASDIAHAIDDQKASEELHDSLHTALLSPEDIRKQPPLSEEAHAIVHKLRTE